MSMHYLDFSRFGEDVQLRPSDTAMALIVNDQEIAFASDTSWTDPLPDKFVIILSYPRCGQNLSALETEALQAFRELVSSWNANWRAENIVRF